MKRITGLFAALSVLSATLLSLPFLVPHSGFLALIGFIPLLFMDRIADELKVRRLWPWHYMTFVMWNTATTFWVCNATIGGGIFAILANSLQMSLVFGLFRLSKKKMSGTLPYIFLAAAWIAWERWYLTDAQISWPWLVLGNSFATSIKTIQWYEWTGTIGGSLWVWAANLGLYGILESIRSGSWRARFNPLAMAVSIISCFLVITVPIIISHAIFARYEETADGLETVILQPNLDPYEKFQALDREEQDSILIRQIEPYLSARDASAASPLLVLAPETFTGGLVTGSLGLGESMITFNSLLKGKDGVNLLFGATTNTVIPSPARPTPCARQLRDNLWLESHNSAIITDGRGRNGIYHKSKLVVGVEMTPYPAVFRPLDDMLGGVMGRDVGQKERSTLVCEAFGQDGRTTRRIPIGCAICYESVYGEFCTGYVKAGAQALAVITNDAWWGNTPGYRQHLSYSSLRAIETRRDIARCANTGISAFINQKGEITTRTSWWERETLEGTVNLNAEETFFVRHGDITGRLCSFIFILLLLSLTVKFIIREPHR